MERLEITYMSVDEIEPYENNAKIHTDEQIEQIKRSIEAFGFNDPIAVDENNTIIEGHGRIIAAKELGFKTIPTIILDGLTDQEKQAYILVHNQLTLNTGFDLDVLNDELDQINFDMSQFGFEKLFIEPSDLKDTAEGFDEFSLTLVFPKGEEDLVNDYIKKQGKDYIVDNIIMEVVRNATMRKSVCDM